MKTLKQETVNKVFNSGRWLNTANIKAVFIPSTDFGYMVSAPKKNFKRAVDRNRIKRLLRLAIQKQPKKDVNICFIYSPLTIVDYKELELNITQIFNRL